MKSSIMRTGTEARQRWMIVDDNPQFLEFLQQAAGLYTDRVIECFDGPQSALAAFEADPEAFELVITDLEMPGMDGMELCRRLRQRSPALKVLLATGSWQLKNDEVQQGGFCGLLRKPFPLTDFARILACAGIGKIGITLATL